MCWSVTRLGSAEKESNLTEQAAKTLAINLSNWNVRVRLTNEETGEFQDLETYEESVKRWTKRDSS